MNIRDFINNALRIKNIEDKQEARFVLTEEQRDVLATINVNEKILIKKDRCTGITTLLAAYVAFKMLTIPNRIYVYTAPNTSLRDLFMQKVNDFIKQAFRYEYNNFHFITETVSNKKVLHLNNGSKLLCRRNSAESFCSIAYIDMIIYDEVGFDKDNFNALIKTIGLYKNIKSLKTVFTLTNKEKGKCIDISNKSVENYFKENKDFTTVDMDTLSYVKQKMEEQSLYNKIKELYGE